MGSRGAVGPGRPAALGRVPTVHPGPSTHAQVPWAQAPWAVAHARPQGHAQGHTTRRGRVPHRVQMCPRCRVACGAVGGEGGAQAVPQVPKGHVAQAQEGVQAGQGSAWGRGHKVPPWAPLGPPTPGATRVPLAPTCTPHSLLLRLLRGL